MRVANIARPLDGKSLLSAWNCDFGGGGKVVGSSDATGEHVVSRPVTPVDMLGSLYERCGIDPAQPFPANPIGLREPILPGADPKKRLREIYL